MNGISEEPRFFTLDEVAEILRVSKRTIHRMIQQRKMPAFKVGGQWRIPETRFRQWIEQRENRISELQ